MAVPIVWGVIVAIFFIATHLPKTKRLYDYDSPNTEGQGQ